MGNGGAIVICEGRVNRGNNTEGKEVNSATKSPSAIEGLGR